MKKVVLKLDLHNEKERQKAMKAVSILPGVDSIAIDMKDKKLTVTGDVDPVKVVEKLRKNWRTDLVSVGPNKAPEKKEKSKKDEKDCDPREVVAELVKAYEAYSPYLTQPYVVHSREENPNDCVIS